MTQLLVPDDMIATELGPIGAHGEVREVMFFDPVKHLVRAITFYSDGLAWRRVYDKTKSTQTPGGDDDDE